jgi:hypothetical protein
MSDVRTVCICGLLVGVLMVTAGASAQDIVPPDAPAGVEAESPAAVDVGEGEELPPTRASRWAPMSVSYMRMNLLHPTLYYRSVQERREFPDAVARGCCGRVASGMYEIVQFPVQFALTPLLVLMNPPWQMEQARP